MKGTTTMQTAMEVKFLRLREEAREKLAEALSLATEMRVSNEETQIRNALADLDGSFADTDEADDENGVVRRKIAQVHSRLRSTKSGSIDWSLLDKNISDLEDVLRIL